MLSPKAKTGLVIVGFIVALLAFDLVMLMAGGATVSQTMNYWARTSPVIPFAFGVVAGHLFWPIWVGDKKP